MKSFYEQVVYERGTKTLKALLDDVKYNSYRDATITEVKRPRWILRLSFDHRQTRLFYNYLLSPYIHKVSVHWHNEN